MKRLLFLTLLLLGVARLSAQNYIVVNSEDIFTSLDDYNTAIADLDSLSTKYQAQVDAKFAAVETLYNTYDAQKASLPAATRQIRENQILTQEQAAQKFQEDTFGQEGTLMKQRVSVIQPIQKRVFDTIEAYAKQVGADVVLDSANNPTLLYSNPDVVRTQQIIDLLKTNK